MVSILFDPIKEKQSARTLNIFDEIGDTLTPIPLIVLQIYEIISIIMKV